jgi:hypothetical protein
MPVEGGLSMEEKMAVVGQPLIEFKKKLKFETGNTRADAELSEALMRPEDCFGLWNDPAAYECKVCLAPVRFNGQVIELRDLCEAVCQERRAAASQNKDLNATTVVPQSVSATFQKVEEPVKQPKKKLPLRKNIESAPPAIVEPSSASASQETSHEQIPPKE